MMRTTPRIIAVLFPIAMVLCGCPSVAVYQKPVATYAAATTASAEAINETLSTVNELHWSTLLLQVQSDQAKQVGLAQLVNAIEPEDITRRHLALLTIARFGERLSVVIESDVADRIVSSTANLSDSIIKLESSISKSSNPQVKTYGKPIGDLVGLLGKAYANHERKLIIEEGIKQGTPQVLELVKLLREDFKVLMPFIEQEYNNRLITTFDYYNSQRQKLSYDERKRILDLIFDLQRTKTLFLNNSVLRLLDDLEEATKALKQLAESSKSPKDFSDFADRISTFLNSATTAVKAVREIRYAHHVTE